MHPTDYDIHTARRVVSETLDRKLALKRANYINEESAHVSAQTGVYFRALAWAYCERAEELADDARRRR
jgi:hypothetical protein